MIFEFITTLSVNAVAGVSGQHRITQQPTTQEPTVEVTEEDEVKTYKWYKIIKSNNFFNKITYQNNDYKLYDKNNNLVDPDNYLSYDVKENTYSQKYNIWLETTGYVEVKENAKIKLKTPYNKDLYLKDSNDNGIIPFAILLNGVDDTNNNIEKSFGFSLDNSSCNPSISDSKISICTEELDISKLKPGFYHMNLYTRNEIKGETDEYSIKFTPENMDFYGFELIKDQNTKTLEKSEEDTRYLVNIIYEPNKRYPDNRLESVYFKTDKSTPGVGPKIEEKDDTPSDNPENNPEDKPIKKIEEKITDIVENPLTGDNIIYTVVLGFISLTMVITLTRKIIKKKA